MGRPRTIAIRRISRTELAEGRAKYPVKEYWKPRNRSECIDGPRPCPFVSCQYHLYLDVSDQGSIKYNFPDLDVDQIPETCALDVADRKGATLEEVGRMINVTRERVRQMTGPILDTIKSMMESYR